MMRKMEEIDLFFFKFYTWSLPTICISIFEFVFFLLRKHFRYRNVFFVIVFRVNYNDL